MSYFETVVNFLTTYDYAILIVAFAFVWVFGVVNFCRNPYRKLVKQLNRCHRKLLQGKNLADVCADAPVEYRRQWRAYANGGAERPSLVFEFVPAKKKATLVWLFVLSAVVSTVYLALFVLDTTHFLYVVYQVAFWLSFVIVTCISKAIFAKHEKRARQTFGKFVACLNAAIPAKQPQAKVVVDKIDSLKKTDVDGATLQQASEILHQYGLENERTVEQQRQINQALNGLLQSYARNASRNGASAHA